MKEIDKSHGSAWDRGSADAYYGREKDPHKWPEGTYKGTRVNADGLTPEELNQYHSAYDNQSEFKQW